MSSRTEGAVGAVGFGASPVPTVAGMEGKSVTAAINVTPMVDVMLVLLIIFMVVTPILTAFQAELPEAAFVIPEPDDDVITLGIDADGVHYIGNDPVAPSQVATRLRQIYYQRPGDHLLYLRADRNVGYDVVLSAVEAARAAGVRTIGAITTPVEEETRTASTPAPPEGPVAVRGRNARR